MRIHFIFAAAALCAFDITSTASGKKPSSNDDHVLDFSDTGAISLAPIPVSPALRTPVFDLHSSDSDSDGRDLSRHDFRGRRIVTGAVVLNEAKDKVLLITTTTGKWGLPKGGWDTTDPHMVIGAAREAYEEAGVFGVFEKTLGVWATEDERFTFFQMTATETLRDYPERGDRSREWVSYEKAVKRLYAKKRFQLHAIHLSDIKRESDRELESSGSKSHMETGSSGRTSDQKMDQKLDRSGRKSDDSSARKLDQELDRSGRKLDDSWRRKLDQEMDSSGRTSDQEMDRSGRKWGRKSHQEMDSSRRTSDQETNSPRRKKGLKKHLKKFMNAAVRKVKAKIKKSL